MALGQWTLTGDEVVLAGLVLGAALLVLLVGRFWGVRLASRVMARTRTTWDDAFSRNKILEILAWIAPLAVLYKGLDLFPVLEGAGRNVIGAIIFLQFLVLFDRVLSTVRDIYDTYPIARRRPIKGPLQLIKIFAYVIGGIVAVCLLLDKSPWGILSGIGAATAIVLLVFKDTILSFVAGIQMTANDLVRVGDWIEMPQFGADGDVVDVALHQVRVQNWDKTIVAIPTYKFMDSSFKNWRGMSEAGGRRIKRALLIDQSSVSFADAALLERLGKVQLLAPYLEAKAQDIEEANRVAKVAPGSPLNGRRQTNLGLFRAYAEAYLRHHQGLRQDMTLMVRHLAPEADSGLPMEVYCFTNVTNWTVYEGIQADIFDHLLSAMPEFGLRAYQRNALVDGRCPESDGAWGVQA